MDEFTVLIGWVDATESELRRGLVGFDYTVSESAHQVRVWGRTLDALPSGPLALTYAQPKALGPGCP